MIDHFHQGDDPRIVCYVPSETVYLVSCLLSLAVVAVVSRPLLRWYDRRPEGDR